MRVMVGFFGITRSLRFTIGSIRDNILAPLREQATPLILAGHFHLPAIIENVRSGEISQPADPDEAALLGLDRCEIEPQEIGLIEHAFQAARRYPDILRDDYASVRNLCFQLRSLDRLWSLMALGTAGHVTGEDATGKHGFGENASGENSFGENDYAVFLRPDLMYLDRIDIPALITRMQADGHDLAVPSWHGWGGLNDRFAVANQRAAMVYATRLRLLGDGLAAHGGLHGESLLALAASTASLRITELPGRALRIRAGGMPEPRDLREFALVSASEICAGAMQRTIMTAPST